MVSQPLFINCVLFGVPGVAIAHEFCCLVFSSQVSATLFFGHAQLAHLVCCWVLVRSSVPDWRRMPVSRASSGRSGPKQRHGHSEDYASRRSSGRWRMRLSPIAAASSTSTRRAARCCLCSNAGGSPKANSTSSWTRAATSPCSSQASRARRLRPTHFQARPPPWNLPTPVHGYSPRPTRRAIGRRRRPSQPSSHG